MSRPEAPDGLVEAARRLLGADARPLAGGYSGETYLVGAAGEENVLRLYLRDPERAAVDAALLRLVRGLVPVPRVLDLRTAPTADEPAFLLTERVPGGRLDLLLREAGPDVRRRAGESAGRVLARLAGMPFLQVGRFAGPDLTVVPFDADPGGLSAWVEAHAGAGAFAEWKPSQFGALLDVARAGQDLLESIGDTDAGRRVCLCHSDFNPKNVLVDPGSGGVTALLDWEFAFAGAPWTDLGNLLRFETDEAFCRAVYATYLEHAPAVPANVLDLARATDLIALVDLAARTEQHAVTRSADELLRRIARAGDVAGGRPTWS